MRLIVAAFGDHLSILYDGRLLTTEPRHMHIGHDQLRSN